MARHEATPAISRTDSRRDVLGVLADPTCRTMLHAISDQALTAAEVSETAEIPLSTVYRKFKLLTDTPLVEATQRLSSNGKHPRQYRCTFDRIHIRMSETTARH